ncbi:MAG: DNA polymerase Y family protein [Acidimicrobiales bacterium]
MPRFPLSCELADRPELAGLPVTVTRHDTSSAWAVSPEAEAEGVSAGQSVREALARCPAMAVIEGRPARYDREAEGILAALEQVAPGVEPGPEAGIAYVELGGLARCWPAGAVGGAPGAVGGAPGSVGGAPGPPETLWAALLSCAPDGLRPRLGVAPGKLAALVAAREAGAGQAMVLTHAEASSLLAPQPVDVLPVPAEMLRRLRLFGITTLGALAALPPTTLTAQFAEDGRRAWELARGWPEPVRPRPWRERVEGRMAFDDPLVSREAVLVGAQLVLARALAQPARRGRASRQAVLRATTERGGRWERTVTLKDAVADRARLWDLLRPYVAEARLPGPVSGISIELAALVAGRGHQGELFPDRLARAGAAPPGARPEAGTGPRRAEEDGARRAGGVAAGTMAQRERLEDCLRQLEARYGYCPVGRVVVVEPWSRIPERRLAIVDLDL